MAEALYDGHALPVASIEYNSTAWLGALCLIATEASLFAYLLFSYAYTATQHGAASVGEVFAAGHYCPHHK
jgi:hypothetical protein